MGSIATAIRNLPWLELVAGALLGALMGLVTWLLTRSYESYIVSMDLPYRISGTWFSAEFDPKVHGDSGERNTFTVVKIHRALGGRFVVRVIKQLTDAQPRAATAWKLIGKINHGDTLVGTWQSTVKNTKRFGAAVLKFTDYGRGVGYWIGPAGKDYPVYGYWIMTRKEGHTRLLAHRALQASGFDFEDVVGCVINEPPFEDMQGTV